MLLVRITEKEKKQEMEEEEKAARGTKSRRQWKLRANLYPS